VLVFSVAVTAWAVTVRSASDTVAVLLEDALPADTPVSVTVTVVLNKPSLFVYVWLPVTVNVPPEPVTVPTELLPSPQLMLAVNSPEVSVPGSVNVATVPLKMLFSLIEIACAVTVRSASDTVAVLVPEALPPDTPVSVTVTVVVKAPSLFAYVWLPVTVNVPLEPVTVPVELLPSPQLMLAVNSPEVSVPGSVNVAT
jgi:hypothetical protein